MRDAQSTPLAKLCRAVDDWLAECLRADEGSPRARDLWARVLHGLPSIGWPLRIKARERRGRKTWAT